MSPKRSPVRSTTIFRRVKRRNIDREPDKPPEFKAIEREFKERHMTAWVDEAIRAPADSHPEKRRGHHVRGRTSISRCVNWRTPSRGCRRMSDSTWAGCGPYLECRRRGDGGATAVRRRCDAGRQLSKESGVREPGLAHYCSFSRSSRRPRLPPPRSTPRPRRRPTAEELALRVTGQVAYRSTAVK